MGGPAPKRPSLYDEPLYYDVLYGWDRDAEAEFYDKVFRVHGVIPPAHVLEVACGTGQIAIRLAQREWQVAGFDLRPAMLRFLKIRASAAHARVETFCADMTQFAASRAFDPSLCPVGSFHLLASDDSVLAHLWCVASTLRAGGIYVLDLTLSQEGKTEHEIEDWGMERGPLSVRASTVGLTATNAVTGERKDLDWGGDLRPYTADGFRALLDQAGCFSIASFYPERRNSIGEESSFDLCHRTMHPDPGRCIVVLQC